MLSFTISILILSSFSVFEEVKEEPSEQQLLMTSLKKGTATLEDVKKIIHLIENDPVATKNVAINLSQMLSAKFNQYKNQYLKEVLLYRKNNIVNPSQGYPSIAAEVKALQKKIMQLREKNDNLTKEDIIKEGDPALKRLKEIYYIDPSIIHKVGGDNLLKNRQLIFDLSELLIQCESMAKMNNRTKSQIFYNIKSQSWKDRVERFEMIESFKHKDLTARLSAIIANERIVSKIDSHEALGLIDLNIYRILVGCKALTVDLKLSDACRDHSKDMHDNKFFDHISPLPKKKTPWDRAALFKTKSMGENIYMGNDSGISANDSWWHSPGHFVNMLNPKWSIVGYGRYNTYWTQNFR